MTEQAKPVSRVSTFSTCDLPKLGLSDVNSRVRLETALAHQLVLKLRMDLDERIIANARFQTVWVLETCVALLASAEDHAQADWRVLAYISLPIALRTTGRGEMIVSQILT